MRRQATMTPDRRELMRKFGSPFQKAAAVVSEKPRTNFSPVRPMRRAEPRPPSKTLPTPPSAAVIALTRLGFGPRPGDIGQFNSLGSTD